MPGAMPESYWHPLLGRYAGLAPSDLAGLTPHQILDASEFSVELVEKGY